MANQPQQPDTALHNASHLMQYHDLIESIVAALDARDAYTASHSDRVADMVLVLAAALGLDEDETTRIHMAAHLHDIGKIAVPDSVLRKAGPLTRPEWEEMRRHPVTGYEILRKSTILKKSPYWCAITMSGGMAAATRTGCRGMTSRRGRASLPWRTPLMR